MEGQFNVQSAKDNKQRLRDWMSFANRRRAGICPRLMRRGDYREHGCLHRRKNQGIMPLVQS